MSRQAVCLQADTADVPNYLKCNKGVFLEPTYDPVRREVVLRQKAGARLALGTLYKLTLYRPDLEGECTSDMPTSCGIRAFDRAPLEKAYSITFRTVDTDPGNAADETAPAVVFCGAKGAAAALGGCSYGNCHATTTGSPCVPTKSNKYPNCAEGVSFYNLQYGSFIDTEQTAINRVAHQTQMGESASTPEKTPTRFGRAMPIIDAFNPGVAGNPGNSYVLYKVLVGPSIDAAPADIKPSDAEVQRLLDSVVVGMPMPPPDPAAGTLDAEQMLNLSNWIQHGAPLSTCP